MPVPTTSEEWNALADRAEAATGSDRELDALIEVALGQWPNTFEVQQSSADEGEWSVVEREPDGRKVDRFAPARFTGSVDDAMTLVPEGAAFFVEHQPWRLGPTAHAQITLTEGTVDGWVFAVGESACGPALALLAACCRAQADLAVQS